MGPAGTAAARWRKSAQDECAGGMTAAILDARAATRLRRPVEPQTAAVKNTDSDRGARTLQSGWIVGWHRPCIQHQCENVTAIMRVPKGRNRLRGITNGGAG